MSITFWAPEAPTLEQLPIPEQDSNVEVQASVFPEIDLAVANAKAMLAALGLPADSGGEIPVAQLPEVLARALKLANLSSLRGRVTSDPDVSGGELRVRESEGNVYSLGRSCTMISMGRTDEYVERTALRFVELFRKAYEQNYRIVWG
jgi:hypothetical protein